MFSISGKKVLIKVVAQTISIYTMTCFRLPVTLCKDIHTFCVNFWWGSKNGKNKIHRRNLKVLSKPKCLGDLGFRDIPLFNQLLLAKHSWNLIQRPNSLLFKVMVGRYFPHSFFLKANLSCNPSFTWMSILWVFKNFLLKVVLFRPSLIRTTFLEL